MSIDDLKHIEKFTSDGEVLIYKEFSDDQARMIACVVKKLNLVIKNQMHVIRCLRKHRQSHDTIVERTSDEPIPAEKLSESIKKDLPSYTEILEQLLRGLGYAGTVQVLRDKLL